MSADLAVAILFGLVFLIVIAAASVSIRRDKRREGMGLTNEQVFIGGLFLGRGLRK